MPKKAKTFYISTPIYYPSGPLHIGHVLTTTLAWVYANYKKQEGYETFFVTGIDEHGQKIQKKALALNLHPQEYVDRECKRFRDLWILLGIDYDFFSRTTNTLHQETIKKVFNKMLEKGYIYKGNYEGLYSVEDEEFFTKSQAIKKDGKYYHPVSGHLLQEIQEESYFFKMSMFSDWILQYFKNNPEFITNEVITNELINNFLKQGLEDLSITRITFDWGIKLDTNDKAKHIVYVWLDALFNYLTALNYLEENDSNYQKFWVNGNERCHILGKEISRFHSIYWPIFLKSLDLNLPTTEIVHSWIVTPTGKMSKSKGNVIDPLALIQEYGAEQVKYFFASQVNINSDYTFSQETFVNVLNADLANNFGNLVNRVIKMINQSFPQGCKYDAKSLEEIDKEIYEKINIRVSEFQKYMDVFQSDKALKTAIKFSSELNEYIDKTLPWTLKNNLPRLNTVLMTLLNGIYAVAYMLNIVIPNKMQIVATTLKQKSINKKDLNNYKKFDGICPWSEQVLFTRILK
ncbi:methionine--tRNA ligase [Metamycoplasma hyosynoviae]|uniref:Methionine--tRNA ligase n=1 Tax=Metamycoplasma hyosynoviae TaxID=29559 RepID=A0A4R7TRG4_9BACT|nr:methionine--tRNA ligase [Metamycoplasma hyosynoviae]TDU95255.1 methionyl-tRNA synthetase [Metamycoplasma hyosynoviae]